MPFLCCRSKKADITSEVIENHAAEINDLKSQVNDKQREINDLFSEKDSLQGQLRDARAELEKIRQAKAATERQLMNLQEQSKIQKKSSEINKSKREKKKGIMTKKLSENTDAEKTHKEEEDREFLLNAIKSNDILRRLTSEQIEQIIDYMVGVEYAEGHTLIKEGDDGDRFYILQKGRCSVTINGKRISSIEAGSGFGEIAIVFGGKRTATVTAAEPVKAWYLLRNVFKKFTREAIETRDAQVVELMKSCKEKLGITDQFKLSKITQVVNEEEFSNGEYIVRQGQVGKTFYIIKSGEVDVTQNNSDDPDGKSQTWIRVLKTGDYFGEGALLEKNSRRGASVIAKTAKVLCYTLDEESFKQLIDPSDLEPRRSDVSAPPSPVTHRFSLGGMKLQDFNFIAILGSGGFGRVELVKRNGTTETFALKCMKKVHIVETRQEEHVYSEKKIMLECRSDFIVRLYRTFKNRNAVQIDARVRCVAFIDFTNKFDKALKYVYMLMEPCLGGELWKHLRDSNKFSDNRSKFYTACVVEALSYLHKRNILYRDLKPENLLLDRRGYVKIVDFGFAKDISSEEKTWTFCGTPQYVAPEIILNQGHTLSADYWALGILIYEFLTGNPPFDNFDQMKIYRMILKGIDAVDFPVSMKRSAQNLIKRLCKESPAERLGTLKGGISEIRMHKWFSGFDWDGLRNGLLVPEYVPIVSGNEDVGNFDSFQRRHSQEKVPSEESGWDKDF